MSILKPIVDNVVLRVMSFAHPNGLDILLAAIDSRLLLIPAEVYNFDQSSIALNESEESLSELARGLRYATRKVNELPLREAIRYQIWLKNSEQLAEHQSQQSLQIQTLTLEELDKRDELQQVHLIGRGEAACIILAQRYELQAVFLSSDEEACKVAELLGINHTTILEILDSWIVNLHPSEELFEELITGMKMAKFGLKEIDFTQLKNRFSGNS